MLKRLVEFSLTQRLLIALATLALSIAGSLAWRSLPIDAFPDIAPTQVKLILKAPGMTPEEVETRVIVPLEMELLGIPQQVMLRASAKYAIADLTLDFEEGTDIYWARQQVAERFAAVAGDLPATVTGGLAPIATPLSDMYMFTIEGDGLDDAGKRGILDWIVRPALRTVPGVADVNALGGRVRSFDVVPDQIAMAAAGVSVQSLADALAANNANDGAGRLDEGEEALVVRTTGALQSLQDIASVQVLGAAGQRLRVDQIAQVREGSLTRYGAVTRSGKGEAVQGLVIGLRGADAGAVVSGVKARLAELEPQLPPGVQIVPFYDRSDLIQRATGTVEKALLEATVLVVLLLLVFLGDLRAAIVVALILPLSALWTFMLMRVFGLSANLMSLGGLAIAIGMLVDAGVVVVENTVEHLAQPIDEKRSPRLHRIYRAVIEVASPVSAGVIIIGLVFLPLLTLQGLEGKLFAPVALTIVFALIGSLLLSLSVVPVLASWLLRSGAHAEPWLMRQLAAPYARALQFVMRRQGSAVAGAAVVLLLAVAAWFGIGKTFMPTMDEGAVLVQLEKLPSANLAASVEVDLAVQRAILARVPEVRNIIARVGSDELGFDPMGLNQTDSFLELAPRSEWGVDDKEALIDAVRDVLDDFPGTSYAFTQPIEMRVSEMLTGTRGDLAVKIFGPDLTTLNQLAAQIETLLNGIDGAQDVYTLTNEGVQYLEVSPDRQRAGARGVDVVALQETLRAQVEGMPVGTVVQEGRRIPLMIRGDDTLRSDPERFADLPVVDASGSAIRVSDIATVRRVSGPVKVDRENASRFAVVQANVSGRDLVGYVDEAKAAVVAQLQVPPGYRITWGGQFENQQRAAARLGLVVPIALAGIFLVLFSSLGSVRQASLILANIPFALVGGVIALWLTGEYLSVPAAVGFIALLGIAVLNGLVMVAYMNQLRAAGHSALEAVTLGAQRRLRPVLMTASITAFGLVPLLLASGPGSEIQKPLAIVVIGGLLSATVLTLLLLPLLYLRFSETRATAKEITP
ncbi:MAG: Cobalt-zinc-cadmium resistance protein CzcA [Alphaproteobacteria bacterium ADurb.BinA280]|jgi:heavy metal efflux system protein|nr:efflux RND transporter permease subunit [Xanthomonadales bacterium]MCC6506548.1 efflux RND transporter permease subunit [Aquimonas sp.]OPZ13682.1 MAG: Cobalt-zinc-cadmium resistance protein CzcA [Alphaproteobacteria bacterium ADurb.BinA280]